VRREVLQAVVTEHGGKAPTPDGGEGPSLRAIPEQNLAACVAALEALPAQF
jgi:hypothetical protein